MEHVVAISLPANRTFKWCVAECPICTCVSLRQTMRALWNSNFPHLPTQHVQLVLSIFGTCADKLARKNLRCHVRVSSELIGAISPTAQIRVMWAPSCARRWRECWWYDTESHKMNRQRYSIADGWKSVDGLNFFTLHHLDDTYSKTRIGHVFWASMLKKLVEFFALMCCLPVPLEQKLVDPNKGKQDPMEDPDHEDKTLGQLALCRY